MALFRRIAMPRPANPLPTMTIDSSAGSAIEPNLNSTYRNRVRVELTCPQSRAGPVLTFSAAGATFCRMRPHPVTLALALTVGIASAGCGSSAPSPEARLNGTWLWTNGTLITEGWWTFNAKERSYTAKRLEGTQPTHGEFETGGYTAKDDQITFTPRTFTCSDSDPAYTVTYSLTGSSLLIPEPHGFLAEVAGSVFGLLFSPFELQSDDGVVVGCFHPDGTFVESPQVAVAGTFP